MCTGGEGRDVGVRLKNELRGKKKGVHNQSQCARRNVAVVELEGSGREETACTF